MNAQAQVVVLSEEIQNIVAEIERYYATTNYAYKWQKIQHEERRQRLETIKIELQGLMKDAKTKNKRGLSHTGGNSMDIVKVLAVSEGSSAILIAGTWYWVLRQGSSVENWRTKASFVALVLASIAVAVQFVLTIVTQFRPLEALDSASLKGGWDAHLQAHLWLWSFFATGLLSFCGLALAILGKGPARIPAVFWSCLVLGLFFINLILAVNSFH